MSISVKFAVWVLVGLVGGAKALTLLANGLMCGGRLAETAMRNACINNLRRIDGAKEQVALEKKIEAGKAIQVEEMVRFIKGKAFPRCPAGGVYSVSLVDQAPRCSVKEHSIEP